MSIESLKRKDVRFRLEKSLRRTAADKTREAVYVAVYHGHLKKIDVVTKPRSYGFSHDREVARLRNEHNLDGTEESRRRGGS